MWFFLSAVAAHASILPTPAPTEAGHGNVAPPAPTTAISTCEKDCGELRRRDTTSAADASICGYYDGSKYSRLACYYGNECVFHAPDSEFPGMVGCCPTTSATTPCVIFSTCYDGDEISATPQLLSSTTDPFVMLCTYDENSYCHTRTWPDLNVADVACTNEPFSRAETMYTAGSITDEDDDDDQITETLSISWIADAVLLSLRSVAMTTTTTSGSSTAETSSATETATPTPNNVESESEEGSSTPVGTIVGAVVGGVVGLGLITGAAVWFWWRKRKNPEELPHPPETTNLDLDNTTPELDGGTAAGRHELMAHKEFAELPAREVRHELE
ncbi:hypothetical protein BJY04DRAFT_138236 [Aspergillus karnatakaensis]|uniref:uncharacterized protein n=1 Tax=Aspergillus karnatakaensis TaxID=1810916 RepID=UPI003CCD79A0